MVGVIYFFYLIPNIRSFQALPGAFPAVVAGAVRALFENPTLTWNPGHALSSGFLTTCKSTFSFFLPYPLKSCFVGVPLPYMNYLAISFSLAKLMIVIQT